MIAFSLYRIRKRWIPGAFFFSVVIAAAVYCPAADIRLSPPGLRLIRDPLIAIPAEFHYPNRRIKLPAYRDGAGNPNRGWSAKFVETRRFASDQSAWIYYRDSDLKRSAVAEDKRGRDNFRFWPVGTTLVIEIYKGSASPGEVDKLIEIAAMSKMGVGDDSSLQAFYPVNWTYSRFNPDGDPSITAAKVRECHQCHSIAFHYTGDLVFTRFP